MPPHPISALADSEIKVQFGRILTPSFLLPAGVVLMLAASLGMFLPGTTALLFDELLKPVQEAGKVTNYFVVAAVAFGFGLGAICIGHILSPDADGHRHLVRGPVWLTILLAGIFFLIGQAVCYRNFGILAQSTTAPKAEEWESVTASAAVWKYIGTGLLVLASALGCSTRFRTAVVLDRAALGGRYWCFAATFFAGAFLLWQCLAASSLNKALQLMSGSGISPKPSALAELSQHVMLSDAAAACTLVACGFCGFMGQRAYRRSATNA